MVVVVIIGILAAIAVPQIAARMRDRRTVQAAQEIALLYRNARLRALGRGIPVLVRYTPAGGFTVLDTLPPSENCQARLAPTCLSTTWAAPTASRQVQAFNPTLSGTTGVYADLTVTVTALPSNTVATMLETCYSPRGKVYSRTVAANSLDPMTGIIDVNVTRGSNSIPRHVSILPNGMSRLAL